VGLREDPVKRRIRQRRYWRISGWARRRERNLRAERERILIQLEQLEQEAKELGLS